MDVLHAADVAAHVHVEASPRRIARHVAHQMPVRAHEPDRLVGIQQQALEDAGVLGVVRRHARRIRHRRHVRLLPLRIAHDEPGNHRVVPRQVDERWTVRRTAPLEREEDRSADLAPAVPRRRRQRRRAVDALQRHIRRDGEVPRDPEPPRRHLDNAAARLPGLVEQALEDGGAVRLPVAHRTGRRDVPPGRGRLSRGKARRQQQDQGSDRHNEVSHVEVLHSPMCNIIGCDRID